MRFFVLLSKFVAYFLSADERGLHIGETGGYIYYDYQSIQETIIGLSPQNNIGDMIRLDAISPGTQPLPNRTLVQYECLLHYVPDKYKLKQHNNEHIYHNCSGVTLL